jgi:hypothetical protein
MEDEVVDFEVAVHQREAVFWHGLFQGLPYACKVWNVAYDRSGFDVFRFGLLVLEAVKRLQLSFVEGGLCLTPRQIQLLDVETMKPSQGVQSTEPTSIVRHAL